MLNLPGLITISINPGHVFTSTVKTLAPRHFQRKSCALGTHKLRLVNEAEVWITGKTVTITPSKNLKSNLISAKEIGRFYKAKRSLSSCSYIYTASIPNKKALVSGLASLRASPAPPARRGCIYCDVPFQYSDALPIQTSRLFTVRSADKNILDPNVFINANCDLITPSFEVLYGMNTANPTIRFGSSTSR